MALLLLLSVITSLALGQEQVFSLMKCTALPQKIQMHGTAVVGKRVYVFGGDLDPATWSDKAFSAEILQDGQLSQWRPERNLPKCRAYLSNSVEVVNNRIYIVAGSETDNPKQDETKLPLQNDVLWTTVQQDGSLAEWKRSEGYPGKKMLAVASATDQKQLFVSGGSGGGIHATVFSAPFNPDGSLGAWRLQNPLPEALWFHGMTQLENRVYVYGGLKTKDKDSANEKVWSSEVGPDGTLGQWRAETPMPSPMYSSAFKGFNDYLIAVTGRYNNGTPHGNIWYARVVDGRVQQWQMLKSDVQARLYHSTALDETRGTVYVIGGQFRPGLETGARAVLDTVQAFQIAPKQAAPPAAIASAGGTVAVPLASALARAAADRKSVLTIFHSPQVPASKRFWDEVIKSPQFAQLAQRFTLAEVDTSDTNGATNGYKYSIFKVPSVAVIRPDGTLTNKAVGVRTMQDVQTFLSKTP